MTQEAKALDVTIMGREFRVACTDDERADLLRAVDYLDRKMCGIRDAGKVAGVDRIAIMAALNITHDLLKLQMPGGLDLGGLERRIRDMQATIDAALSQQDKLF